MDEVHIECQIFQQRSNKEENDDKKKEMRVTQSPSHPLLKSTARTGMKLGLYRSDQQTATKKSFSVGLFRLLHFNIYQMRSRRNREARRVGYR